MLKKFFVLAYVLKRCGCVKFSMPHKNGTRVCSQKETDCATNTLDYWHQNVRNLLSSSKSMIRFCNFRSWRRKLNGQPNSDINSWTTWTRSTRTTPLVRTLQRSPKPTSWLLQKVRSVSWVPMNPTKRATAYHRAPQSITIPKFPKRTWTSLNITGTATKKWKTSEFVELFVKRFDYFSFDCQFCHRLCDGLLQRGHVYRVEAIWALWLGQLSGELWRFEMIHWMQLTHWCHFTGFLGLLMGGSLLSLVEIFYHFVLRQIFDKKQKSTKEDVEHQLTKLWLLWNGLIDIDLGGNKIWIRFPSNILYNFDYSLFPFLQLWNLISKLSVTNQAVDSKSHRPSAAQK